MSDVVITKDNTKNWYVVQCASGSENRVRKLISDRVAAEGFGAQLGDVVVPMEEVIEMRGEKRMRVNRCFFPGYVLLQAQMSSELWHLLRNIPGVFGFIGGENGLPAALGEQEVDRILKRVADSHESPMPKVAFEVGEAVRIIDGPFADFEAIVEHVNLAKSSLKVSVTVFGRPTPMELSFRQVIKP